MDGVLSLFQKRPSYSLYSFKRLYISLGIVAFSPATTIFVLSKPNPTPLKIQKSIWCILLLIFCGILYFLIFTYQNNQRNQESFQWINHTHEVIENINTVRSAMFDVESQVRGYLVSGNSTFIKDFETKKAKVTAEATRLQQLFNGNNVQQDNSRRLFHFIDEKIAFQNEVFLAAQHSVSDGRSLVAALKGKHLADSVEGILQNMEAEERSLLGQRMQNYQGVTQVRHTTMIVLAVVAVLLLSLMLYNVTRENALRRKAEQKARDNEHKYKSLIENSALVVYTTDVWGNYTYLGGKCKELTGFRPEELLGENFLTLIERTWEQKVKDFYVAQKEKRTYETLFEFPIMIKSGERKWIEQSVFLLEENGAPVGFQCVAKDITEKKYAERLLADAEAQLKAKQEEYQSRLQAILDNMPMIVYLKDLDGRFIMVNKQFHQVLNTTDAAIIGRQELNVHLTDESARKFVWVDEEVKQTRKPVEIIDVIMTSEGERNMSIVKFPLLDKDGNLIAISAVGKDITESIRYQEQLIEARERAERAEQLQEEFLANMSHEIRTPMNGIIGMTDLMQTTLLNGEQTEYLRLIKESSQILLTLINDILDLSKIKAGRMTLEHVDYNLHDTIDAVVAPFALKAREKGIVVEKTIGKVPSLIVGDQHKLVQILNNLLSNAIKFTERGAVTLSVHTEETNERLYLVGAVSDSGIGIAKEKLDDIFDSFVQAGNDMVRRFGGTGLGLTITRRLVELQQGQINVCSELGIGTTFRFRIPVSKSNLQAVEAKTASSLVEIDGKSLRAKKILLIEDNEVNQKVTFLMLHKAGILVDIANHGKEAIAYLGEGRQYDLIITDLQMPEMDGFQTTQYIRTQLGLTTPIIAMTASALRNEKERCLQLGMDEYLSKPFAPNVLFFHIKRLLLAGASEQEVEEEILEEENPELYNLQFLREMDDNEYTAEALELFLQTTEPALEGLDQQIQAEDWMEVYRKAHSLKSSLGLLQMNRMLDFVSTIETYAKTTTNTEKINSLLDNVQQQYHLVKPMLEAELANTRKKILL
jgi:PAS domain S-box-containing protein